jgi:ribosomal protein S18 acetylase RimI-like enzyme
MDVRIRKATIQDLSAVTALSQQLFEYERTITPEYDLAWSSSPAGQKYFTKRLKGRKHFALVAEIGAQIVGYATVGVFTITWRIQKPIVEIENLCVDKGHRGQGIGKALMDEVQKIATRRHAKRLRLSALSHNDHAIRFYRANGYTDVEMVLEKSIE